MCVRTHDSRHAAWFGHARTHTRTHRHAYTHRTLSPTTQNSVVGYASDTPHFSTASVFGLVDGKAPPAYAGDEHVRGILCNKYTMPRRCWGKDCAFNATASFYFNDPAWRLPEDGDNARVPVRVVWEGSTTVNETTGAALDPARRVAFREVMDYVSFHVGEPTEWHFARPCGMACQSVNKAWNAAELPAQPCSAGCPFSGGVSTTSGLTTPAPAPQVHLTASNGS